MPARQAVSVGVIDGLAEGVLDRAAAADGDVAGVALDAEGNVGGVEGLAVVILGLVDLASSLCDFVAWVAAGAESGVVVEVLAERVHLLAFPIRHVVSLETSNADAAREVEAVGVEGSSHCALPIGDGVAGVAAGAGSINCAVALAEGVDWGALAVVQVEPAGAVLAVVVEIELHAVGIFEENNAVSRVAINSVAGVAG